MNTIYGSTLEGCRAPTTQSAKLLHYPTPILKHVCAEEAQRLSLFCSHRV